MVITGSPQLLIRPNREALARAGGNRTEAAKLLGISRATFYRKLALLRERQDG